jgi:pyrimidine-specific ribonucleoside hydrolase
MAVGGNATPWAEANAFYDPEACHVVLTSGLPILMYTWDMYLTVEVSGADLDAMGLGASVDLTAPRSGWAGASDAASSGSVGHFLDGACCLGARLLHRDMKHWAMTSVMVGDAGAVAAVLLPGAVTTRRMHVGVELTGTLTRGMTVCDQRPVVFEPDRARGPLNVDVVVAVDGAALARHYALRVLAPPSNSPYVVRGPPIEKTPLTHAPQPPKCDISTPRHSTVRPSSFQTALRFSVVISALYVVSSAAMSLARR